MDTQQVERTTKRMVTGILRHILTAIGGGFVTDGMAKGDDMQAAVAAVITLVGFVWSVVEKRGRVDGNSQ